MPECHVRATDGARVVLVLSHLYHRKGQNIGRECPVCNVRWKVQIDDKKNFHVWRNEVQADSAILDWTGNNVAIECCQKA
jgi:hypothetical protein